jgi:hypothetical protein
MYFIFSTKLDGRICLPLFSNKQKSTKTETKQTAYKSGLQITVLQLPQFSSFSLLMIKHFSIYVWCQFPDWPTFCHMPGVPWWIITSSGLDLLTLLLQLQSIITAHNQWLPKICSIPSWTTSVFSSTVTDLVLIYESVTSSMNDESLTNERRLHSDWILFYEWLPISELSYRWMTYESITCPPFIPQCEPNTEHYLQQFTLFRVYPLLCKHVLIP